MPSITQVINRPSQSDWLGRYYTRSDIGELLIDCMHPATPSGVLDLGSGLGTLSGAVARRWSNTKILTVDVDAAAGKFLKKELELKAPGRHAHIRMDALNIRLPNLVRNRLGKIDAAVCNPPFIKPVWRNTFSAILEEVGLSGSLPAIKDADAALMFLAQNLRALDKGATLGIILPASMTCAHRYLQFREKLFSRYRVDAAIKLPRSSFVGTEALASIVILKCEPPKESPIRLYKLTEDRRLTDFISVYKDEAMVRLDYDYHAIKTSAASGDGECVQNLASLCLDVRRGSIQNSVAKANNTPVFHTTSMVPANRGRWVDISELTRNREVGSEYVLAEPGDILVARVGRNLGEKTCGVSVGSMYITDCVYRIRVKEPYRSTVLAQLSSKKGIEWLESRAYGVAARQLTKSDLLMFPISL